MKKKLGIRFSTGVKYKNRFVLSSAEINGLWVYDFLQEKFLFYQKFEKEDDGFYIHRKAFLHNDEAWFVPQTGKYIAVVNLHNYDVTYLEIPHRNVNRFGREIANATVYSAGVFDDHFLYLVPSGIDAVNIFDMRDRSVQTFYDINTDKYFLAHGFYANRKIYMYPWNKLVFKGLNLETGAVEIVDFKMEEDLNYGEAFMDIASNTVYIAPGKNSSCLYYIDISDFSCHKIELNEDVSTEHAVDYGNEVVFWGVQSEKIVILNKRNKSAEVKKISVDIDPEDIVYVSVDSDSDKVVISGKAQRWYRYDAESREFEQNEMNTDYETICVLLENGQGKNLLEIQGISNTGIIRERCLPLDCFLEKITLKRR